MRNYRYVVVIPEINIFVAVTFSGEAANRVVELLSDNCACKKVKEKPPTKKGDEDGDDDDDEPQSLCTGRKDFFYNLLQK